MRRPRVPQVSTRPRPRRAYMDAPDPYRNAVPPTATDDYREAVSQISAELSKWIMEPVVGPGQVANRPHNPRRGLGTWRPLGGIQ